MITIVNRDGIIAWQSLSHKVIISDDFEQPVDNDMSIYTCVLDKNATDTKNIAVGYILFAKDGNKLRSFEIMTIEQTQDTMELYCIDVGIDLHNEAVEPYSANASYPIEHYLNKFLYDSGWEIGVVEISNVNKKLEWTGTTDTMTRLKQLANRFGVFLEFDYVLDDIKIKRKLIHVRQKRGQDKKVRLVYGREVQSIKKNESIMDLATSIIAKGENDITLKGYVVPPYDREIWHIDNNGWLIHKPSTKEWHRYRNHEGIPDWWGNIPMDYTSTAKTQKTLYDECKLQILKRNEKKVTYTVDVDIVPERIRRGDTVVIVDHDFKPPLILNAEVTGVQNISFVNEHVGTIIISNYKEQTSAIDYRIQRLQQSLRFQESTWQSVPYILNIKTSNGTIFQNNNIATTLTAKITKNDIDVTNTMTRIVWERVSRYNTTGDAEFHREGMSISITKDDVDVEARFICKAYINDDLIAQSDIVIKDFVMATHKGEMAPKNPDTGTLWIDTNGGKEVIKIYDTNSWVPVQTEVNMEGLQDGLEPYLAPIREKQQLLKAELQAKATKDIADKMLAEFQEFVQQINDNRKVDGEQLLSLLQRLALQETNFGKFKNQWNFLDGFITFSDEGMYIGSKESSTSILVANGGITIFSNGSEVASFKEGYMKIDNGIFTRSVQIGTKWRIQPYRLNDDVLAFIFLGGVIEVV